MVIIGLTGSIGMGKSTTAALFRAMGVPVHDADAEVHALYDGAAAASIEAAFPGVLAHGRVARPLLGARVLGDPDAMRRLEAIIHPLVRDRRDALLMAAHKAGRKSILLDIPLLFETGADCGCDVVTVVSAPFAVQKQRVLARTAMTDEKFHAILDRQMPDAEKRKRAHFVIDTGRGIDAARRQVRDFLRAIETLDGRNWRALLIQAAKDGGSGLVP